MHQVQGCIWRAPARATPKRLPTPDKRQSVTRPPQGPPPSLLGSPFRAAPTEFTEHILGQKQEVLLRTFGKTGNQKVKRSALGNWGRDLGKGPLQLEASTIKNTGTRSWGSVIFLHLLKSPGKKENKHIFPVVVDSL